MTKDQKHAQLRRQRERAEQLAAERRAAAIQKRWQGITAKLTANSKIRGSVAAKG